MTATDDPILDAWRISARVTAVLVESIPPALWSVSPSGLSRRTIRSTAAHLHNTRGLWIRTLAAGTDVPGPARVDAAKVSLRELLKALDESGDRILEMLRAGLSNQGEFPEVSSAFVYGAMPRNVVLFVAYALSHEAHHRGQILLMARALGQKLPAEAVGGLWQWSSRLKEARGEKPRAKGPVRRTAL